MKKILVLILLIPIFPDYSFAFDDGNFQYWNSESIETILSKSWKIKVKEEFRFGNNASSFYYNSTDIGLGYFLNKYLEFSMNYGHIYEKNNNDWKLEYRPHINGTVKMEWHDFIAKDRNRFEYRIRESARDLWRYRNKLSIELPFKWTRFDIQPYIADEIFVDFDKKELNRNRLYLGFSLKLLKNLKGEIFYLWQSSKKSNKWKDCNVLGTSLKLAF